MFSVENAFEGISSNFDKSVVPTLVEYIRIPNLSPSFNGGKFDEPETEQVIDLFSKWVHAQAIPGLSLEIRRLPQRTPLMFLDLPASPDYKGPNDCVLMYGHLDKQPPFEGWLPGTGPYEPVIKEGRLYGRGGADDGYALFGSIEALKTLHAQKIPHARIVILIEACEESGSPDLPAHLSSLIDENKLGNVSLVVCLDSGAGSYDAFYLTASIRGMFMTTLTVTTLTEGVHSGGGGNICADSFRIIRQLLSSIEDEATGEMIPELQVSIPSRRIAQNKHTVAQLGSKIYEGFPLINGIPMCMDLEQLALNRGWKASLTVTGMDGLPPCAKAGNVLRPSTTVKLSIRLPPSYDHTKAFGIIKSKFEAALPPNARMELSPPVTAKGWDAPETEPWLEKALNRATSTMFPTCTKPGYIFEGGSIPFLGMLQDMFPRAQFCVTGVLGPHSNAHGPNEFLDIEYCKRVVTCVAAVVAGHGTRDMMSPSGVKGKENSASEASAQARVEVAREDKLVQQKITST
jgi:acetylornithine deacetylase/succinyl-diaminopimelate desuccinylase-like protein